MIYNLTRHVQTLRVEVNQGGRRWHAGIEGRISVTKRKHGLDRCLNRGADGFQRWVGWGVIANNLTLMGRKLAQT